MFPKEPFTVDLEAQTQWGLGCEATRAAVWKIKMQEPFVWPFHEDVFTRTFSSFFSLFKGLFSPYNTPPPRSKNVGNSFKSQLQFSSWCFRVRSMVSAVPGPRVQTYCLKPSVFLFCETLTSTGAANGTSPCINHFEAALNFYHIFLGKG